MPQHKRGPWSPTEDQYLVHLVGLHGAHNWVRISSTIQTRSPKQCRERFHQNLKPNLNHDPITPEEGILIEQMVAEMGKRWAEIARRLRGRSDNAVKNWWNGGMNRRRRSNNSRRTELEVRQQPNLVPNTHSQPIPEAARPQPPTYTQQPSLPPQYYSQPMWYPNQVSRAQQPMAAPPQGMLFRQPGMMETPLQSPSGFSQFSADGAPSLMSDRSSSSATDGPSPIELPPLSGATNERQPHPSLTTRSTMPYVQGSDAYHPQMETKQPQYVLRGHYPPQHSMPFPQPTHYLPSQARQPNPVLQHPFQHHYEVAPSVLMRNSNQYAQPHYPSTPAMGVQLPSIADLTPSVDQHYRSMGMPVDSTMMQAHMSSTHALHSPEGSPKDKMSLSNLTH